MAPKDDTLDELWDIFAHSWVNANADANEFGDDEDAIAPLAIEDLHPEGQEVDQNPEGGEEQDLGGKQNDGYEAATDVPESESGEVPDASILCDVGPQFVVDLEDSVEACEEWPDSQVWSPSWVENIGGPAKELGSLEEVAPSTVNASLTKDECPQRGELPASSPSMPPPPVPSKRTPEEKEAMAEARQRVLDRMAALRP